MGEMTFCEVCQQVHPRHASQPVEVAPAVLFGDPEYPAVTEWQHPSEREAFLLRKRLIREEFEIDTRAFPR